MDETCLSFNLGDVTCGLPNSDIKVTVSTATSNRYASSELQGEINQQLIKPRKRAEEKSKTVTMEAFKSSDISCSSAISSWSDSCVSQCAVAKQESLNASENNSGGGGKCGCNAGGGGSSGAIKGSRRKTAVQKGRPSVRLTAGLRQHRLEKGGGGEIKGEGESATAAAELMNCCVQNTVDQAKQMYIKGTNCSRENPYAGLGTETFKKLLRGRRNGGGGKAKTKAVRKKIKWCKPKTDECDGIQLQLCPKLGEGHTHEKLIDELAPVLLRATQSLDCQLREICRRLFFMKHNVPQMTAPALVNFHAILSEITRMLLADFASFPAGLALPTNNEEH